MGSYNTAVITTVGQALLTSVLGAQGTMTFTKLQTSSYAYASGTDLTALTSLNNVEQEVNVGAASIIDSTHIAADATISNTGVTTEYNANTLGIFATDGNSEVLFAVSTAVTPDVIPVDSGGTPSTYKYKFTLAVSSTSDITISALGNGSVVHAVYEESPALAAHAVGTYVYFNSHVYKVTSAIAIGDAVAVGTNVALDPSLSGDDLITIEGVPGNSIIAASQISYNNASSGLSATKVQGAIDEVNSNLGELDKGTYNVSLIVGTTANSFSRATYNFIRKNTYSVTLNSAKEMGINTELKNDFNVASSTGIVTFYTTQSYAGKLISFNITVS